MSQAKDTDFIFIYSCSPVTAPDIEDAERLLASTGKHRLGYSTAARLDAHWINDELCPTHDEWRRGVASAGPGAQLPCDDWLLFLRLNPYLIDSRMRELVIEV